MHIPDPIDGLHGRFSHAPLAGPVFLNSVPKCGTHLLRNVMRMFTPFGQHYHGDYVQLPILDKHLAAFDPARPMISWGHMLFDDRSAMALKHVRMLILVRDPYDWVLARARYYLSGELRHPINHVKGGKASVDQVIMMMILGVHEKVPDMAEVFLHNAAAWMGAGAKLVRYEDLAAHANDTASKASEAWFRELLAACGLGLPDDWRERVAIGADRRHSRTARENLTMAEDIPDELSDLHKRLVDYAAPGLRALLGYA